MMPIAEIERTELSLAAPWASGGAAWLLFGMGAMVVLTLVFYFRWQSVRWKWGRMALAAMRAAAFCLVLLILAEPVATVHESARRRGTLWLLFDGTDSMALIDALPPEQRKPLAETVGLTPETLDTSSRTAVVRAFLQRDEGEWLTRLEDKFRIQAFLFDRIDGATALELSPTPDGRVDPEHLAGQLTDRGEVTALGAALSDLAGRPGAGSPAGVVIFSDFNQNAGPPASEAADRLGVPIHTVGIGPTAAVDLAVELSVPPLLKKDERSSLSATVRQEGFDGEEVAVVFGAQLASGDGLAESIEVGRRIVTLQSSLRTVEVDYLPTVAGRVAFSASVEPMPRESIDDNNRATRRSTVRDDFLRVLHVAYEPTWEWRFVKEVFHRDRLVGPEGFRTYLRSADPRVRRSNDMFIESAVLPRSEFFAQDVILLGDMPASSLEGEFCRLAREFVADFGGGLVIIAGPRFGPSELLQTPLAELLPVRPMTSAELRDDRPFVPTWTPEAAGYDFLRLGDNEAETERAWRNMGRWPWYHPVERRDPLAVALAVHPTDKCPDGKTPQPIIAARQFGRGEVVYIGMNEMWRLRRKHGDRYYRRFWGQLIHRLALRHALGDQKRFVLRTDRPRYRAGDEVRVTIDAYDADFQPLTEDQLVGRTLQAELIGPSDDIEGRTFTAAQRKPGVFEVVLPVFAPGEHRIRVHDPIADEPVETTFLVQHAQVERQRAVRNGSLQRSLAMRTGGKTFDLLDVASLRDRIEVESRVETSARVIPLWNTWAVFLVLGGLLLGEWLLRKWMQLP